MLILLEHDRSLDLKPYRVGNGPETTSASELAGNNALNVGRVAGWAADIAIRTCGATFFENSSKKCGAASAPAATLIVVVPASTYQSSRYGHGVGFLSQCSHCALKAAYCCTWIAAVQLICPACGSAPAIAWELMLSMVSNRTDHRNRG